MEARRFTRATGVVALGAHRLAVASAVALALLAPLAASAQSSDAAAPARRGAIDEVLVTGEGGGYAAKESASATKLNLSLRETPQSLTVLTRERLDDQNLQSLRDVLDATPGVYSYQWDSERVIFTSRGFTVDNLLYDGVPALSNFNTDSIDETIDTALYDRIEIVRGATGLLTGAGSPAASVNLVRKHATATALEVETQVTVGSWSDVRADVDVSVPLNADGSVRGRFIGVVADRESYQDLYESQKRVFYGVVDADLGARTQLSVGFDWQQYEPTSNTWGSFPLFLGDETPASWPRSITTATDWAFWNKNKKAVFAELRHSLGDDWTLRASVTARDSDEDMALFYMYGFPDPMTGEGLEPYAYRSAGTADERLLDVYASGRFVLFGREHELVVGVNASDAVLDSFEYAPGEFAPVGNFFEWDGSYPSPGFDPVGEQISDIDSEQLAVYAAARFELGSKLRLIAGARYERAETDYYYSYDSPPGGFQYDQSATIPYAGLIYDFSEPFSAFVSVTEIFDLQNARDANNRFLDPIEGKSLDVGVKGEHLGGRLTTAVTLFKTLQDNVAEPVFDEDGNPVVLPDLTQASRPIDGARTRGIEAEVAGEIRRGWNASLGWSRYILEDADGAAVKSFIPRTVLKLFTRWTPPSYSRLAVGGGVSWQSQSDTFVSSPGGGTQLVQGDVTLLSLFARYQLSTRTSLQLNAENVLDERYYVLDNYDNTYFGAPRNYSLGVSVRF